MEIIRSAWKTTELIISQKLKENRKFWDKSGDESTSNLSEEKFELVETIPNDKENWLQSSHWTWK